MLAEYGNGQPDTAGAPHHQARQIRRAWGTLVAALGVACLLCSGLAGGGYWYRGHATTKHTACVEVVKGDRAFIRPAYQRNWSAIPADTNCANRRVELHEGDALQTAKGTHVLLTLWDNTLVEVFEQTELEVTELRTTQYISRASNIAIRQTGGLIRVSTAPGGYARSRFQVSSGDTAVSLKEDTGSSGGSFIVQVLAAADPVDTATRSVRASVRRGNASVRVAGYPGEVRLGANEQTIVPPNGPAGVPTPSRLDLVANGRFVGNDGRFSGWNSIGTPGQVDGPFGKLALVPDTLRNEEIEALEISRGMNSVDHAITGLRQPLDVNVAELASLTLSADIQVIEQNVPGGGDVGSEFPILVRINYYDPSGTIQNRVWGFYVVPPVSGVKPPNGSQVKAGEWFPFSVELRDLVPQPLRLESIDIYASGHGYRARITNVAIVGAEVTGGQ